MKRLSIKNLNIFIIAFLIIFILCVIFFAATYRKDNLEISDVTEAVEVYVNGEALYVFEVDETLVVNPEVSREEVIENTINDMLMIQYARANNIDVTDEEVEYILNLYQTHYPEIYEIALEGYGTEGLTSGIKNRLLLTAALESILEEPDYTIDLSNEAIDKYLLENGIEPDSLEEAEYEEARILYVNAQEVKMKEAWIENARLSAEIIYKGESESK